MKRAAFYDRRPDLSAWNKFAEPLVKAARDAAKDSDGRDPPPKMLGVRTKRMDNALGLRPTINSLPQVMCVQLLQFTVKDEADIWPGVINYRQSNYRQDGFEKIAEETAILYDGIDERPAPKTRSKLFALCVMADGTRVDIHIADPRYELWVDLSDTNGSAHGHYAPLLAIAADECLAFIRRKTPSKDSAATSRRTGWRVADQRHFVGWTPGKNERAGTRSSTRYCVLDFGCPNDLRSVARRMSSYGLKVGGGKDAEQVRHKVCESRIDPNQKAHDSLPGVSLMDWIRIDHWTVPARYYTHAQVEIEVRRCDIKKTTIDGFAQVIKVAWDIETMCSTAMFTNPRNAGDFCMQINTFVWPHGITPGVSGEGGISLCHHLGLVKRDVLGNATRDFASSYTKKLTKSSAHDKAGPLKEERGKDNDTEPPPVYVDDCADSEVEMMTRWRDTIALDLQPVFVGAWNNDTFDNPFIWYRSQSTLHCVGRTEPFERREEKEQRDKALAELKSSGAFSGTKRKRRTDRGIENGDGDDDNEGYSGSSMSVMETNSLMHIAAADARRSSSVPPGTFPATRSRVKIDYASIASQLYGSSSTHCTVASEEGFVVAPTASGTTTTTTTTNTAVKQTGTNSAFEPEKRLSLSAVETTQKTQKKPRLEPSDNPESNTNGRDNDGDNSNDDDNEENNDEKCMPLFSREGWAFKENFKQRDSDLRPEQDPPTADWVHFHEVGFVRMLRREVFRHSAEAEARTMEEIRRRENGEPEPWEDCAVEESFGAGVGKIDHRGGGRFPYLSVFIFEKKKMEVNDRTSPGFPKPVRHYELDLDGRVFIDLMHYVKSAPIAKMQSYALAYVSEDMFKDEPRLRKIDLPPEQIWENWFRGPVGRSETTAYAARDCLLPANIEAKLLGYANFAEMARLSRTSMQHVAARGVTKRVLNLIIRFCHENGYILNEDSIAKKDGDDDSYDGANVLMPKPGLYVSPVYGADVASLYPSIMEMANTCYSTVIIDPVIVTRMLTESVVITDAPFDAQEIKKTRALRLPCQEP